MSFLVPILVTLVLLVGIVWACSIFTNAIEWLGHRFELSQGAVGSVLAAVGTALPETLVPVVALVGGHFAAALNPAMGVAIRQQAADIGVGAILGAPFLLSTLAMCLAGVAVFYGAWRGNRSWKLHLDEGLFKRDLSYFFLAYVLVFAATMIQSQVAKWALAVLLLCFYGLYVYRTLKMEHIPDAEFDLEPLMLAPRSKEPPTWLIWVQTLMGLLGILIMAHLFVEQIKHLSALLQLSSLVLSLIIAPIATELPEKYNSVVWILKKKDNLALGNITGAMVFQSCIPTAIGLSFTPWVLDFHGQLSVLLCFASAGVIFISVLYRRELSPAVLLVGGMFYLIFLVHNLLEITGPHPHP